jgi:halogenation protein CepH
MGIYDELKKVNYVKKRGLEFVLHGKSTRLRFPQDQPNEPDESTWAFQMPRARFDETFLRFAAKNGVDVREQQAVKRVLFEGQRAVGVEWADNREGAKGEYQRANAKWIVDASGQAGVLNRQIGNNCTNNALLQKKIAVFGHFKTPRDIVNSEDEINFKLCVHKNGRDWAWYLPVERDCVSIGVVLSRDSVMNRSGTIEQLFDAAIAETAFLCDYVKEPGFEMLGKLRSVVDYSYRSKSYCGEGWALVGDSAGFIDPVFSTGLQITFNSAFRLAELLDVALKDPSRSRRSMELYATDLDRFFRVNGTLVQLFTTAKFDPQNYENAWYMWTHIPFAGWRFRAQYLWWGARLMFVPEKLARRWGEEVVFGNPGPDNLVAKMFMTLSRNFDKAFEKELAAAPERTDFIELEV